MAAINTGDTAFLLLAAALVMFMTPGLALFYGGMVRSKNVLATIMQSFFAIAIITIIWILFGYSLAFGPDRWHLIGSLKWIGLHGVGQLPNKAYAPTVPHLAFMMYQGMFAIITPALIAGAFAERMKFRTFLIFTIAWSILVYNPVAHWVWGIGGWIRNLGALDFAGGTVVHVSSGTAALVAALVVGRRRSHGTAAIQPHNIPMAITGAAILWFGWFGFNAGSALTSGGLSSNAFVTTHVAAAAGMIGWVVAEWRRSGAPTSLGAASGAVAGLVGITPAAGFVSPLSAVAIGLSAGAVCFLAVNLKERLGYDDSLDVVGVHLVGGMLGALATGILAEKVINPAGANGLLAGGTTLLGVQAIAVLATIAYSAVMSFVILKVIDLALGLRVSELEEHTGLDASQHNELGYIFGDTVPEPLAASPHLTTAYLSASRSPEPGIDL